MLLSAGRLRTKGFEILAVGGIGNESQASQAGLWQLGGGILGFTGFLLAAWPLAFASACGGGVLRLPVTTLASGDDEGSQSQLLNHVDCCLTLS